MIVGVVLKRVRRWLADYRIGAEWGPDGRSLRLYLLLKKNAVFPASGGWPGLRRRVRTLSPANN